LFKDKKEQQRSSEIGSSKVATKLVAAGSLLTPATK
jgi:hypothetical protein